MSNHFSQEGWKIARQLALFIHQITKNTTTGEGERIADILRSDAITIPTAIGEGIDAADAVRRQELFTEAEECLSSLGSFLEQFGVEMDISPADIEKALVLISECKSRIRTAR